jgi:hypothetical protein
MSAHTPGGWIAVGRRVEHTSDKRPDVCSCAPEDFGQDGRSDKEACANARLIAAAPDMLAALEKLVQQVESGYFDHVATDHPNSAVIAARAAIAKATGVQP